jgi:SpoVK/Ycf46/Vps4 family AAA+-type ATPase
MGLNYSPPWNIKKNKNNNRIKDHNRINNRINDNNRINVNDINKDKNKDNMFLNLLNELEKIDNTEKKDKDKDKTIKKIHIAQISSDTLFNQIFGLQSLQGLQSLPGLQGLQSLQSLQGLKKQNNKTKTNIVLSKDNFEIIPDKIYEEIKIKINTIQDLINLGKMYKENHNYAINLKRLYNLIPTLKKLENVVGMENVKKTIINQIVYFLSGLDCGAHDDMLHTVITGPPGVGKTLLGTIIGEIYYNLGIVKGNGKRYIDPITKEEKNYIFKIAKRSDLIGEYLGHTAIKTQKVIDECEGGVLFIDEAYSLGNEEKKDIYSKECIDTLNQNLTEKKTQFICIIAGYPQDLDKCFFSVNDGLKRRFPFKYNIDKYTPIELTHILMLMIKKKNWKLDNKLSFNEIIEFMKINNDKFPNYGGDIETLFFNIRIAHSLRTIGNLPSIKKYITIEDIKEGLNIYIKSQNIENKKFLDFYL